MTTAVASSEGVVRELAAAADIGMSGSRPWDIVVHDKRFYDRILAEGSLGLGDSYMDGWWDCEDVEEFIFRILRSNLRSRLPWNARVILGALKAKTMNLQTRRGTKNVAETHYDLGNDLFEAMLDPWMQYSCGYFRDTDDLATAQERKLDLIARKLDIKAGDRVLDIGCGWGGLARFLAEGYGCHVTGVNISKEQIAYARKWCDGLPVTIVESDYRDIRGTFDKIVSVGMFEHVGPKNYVPYMDVVHRSLREGGLFLLHSIGCPWPTSYADPWLDAHIFPGSVLPTMAQITNAAESRFQLRDWHTFGHYYVRTLRAWHRNFLEHWDEFGDDYGERFRRMWEFYLFSCAAAFRAEEMQLWQVTFSKGWLPNGYVSAR